MLKIKFIKFAAVAMRDAIEEAKLGGQIVATKYRELNGELYFQIPDEEVELWLDLLTDLAKEVPGYNKIIDEIEALRDEQGYEAIGEGRGEGESNGLGAKPGAAGVLAGKPSGSNR